MLHTIPTTSQRNPTEAQLDFIERYNHFLQGKIKLADACGIDISIDEISKVLFPHQSEITHWALEMGCAGIFGSWGLGKTLMQLEFATKLSDRFNKPVLMGLPLGVRHEFFKDAKKLGVKLGYAKDQLEAESLFADGISLILCNYERIREAKYDPEFFIGTTLDEASAIRSMGTKTTQYILEHLKKIPYRAVFTATPSPNAYHELLKYADFLGHMDISQALSRYFQRDSQKAHNSTLLPHREEDFWKWVHSWSVFITRPSDLGYEDTGYDLPPLKVHWREVKIENRPHQVDEEGNIKLIPDQVKTMQEAAIEKQFSKEARIAEMKKIIDANPDDHFLIWHHLEPERKMIKKILGSDAVSVYGSQDWDAREKALLDFSEGRKKYMSTKPSIAGQGNNFQYHCHKAIFVGVDDKFNDFIQAIHRIYRFMQAFEVEIYIIFTDLEHVIIRRFEAKWKRHNYMIDIQRKLIKKYGLHRQKQTENKRKIMTNRLEYRSQDWIAINNDAIYELPFWADNCIHMYGTSIPFSDLFEYADSHNDMGQSLGDEEFFQHMDFLTPHMFRTLMPGRLCVIHVKDVIKWPYQNDYGFAMTHRFSDRVCDHFEKHGFGLMCRITVATDVVKENDQSHRLGYSEFCKDATKMGAGLPEYILVFRKPQTNRSRMYADNPVTHEKEDYWRARWQLDAHSIWKSSGNRMLTSKELAKMGHGDIMEWWTNYDLTHDYDYQTHVELCQVLENLGKLPPDFMVMPPRTNNPNVWDDIQRINTLNSAQVKKRLVKHVCPLQLDLCERIIERSTNPGEVVVDPFAGIFSMPRTAIKMGRRAIGIELSEGYWKDGIKHMKAMEYKLAVPTLFDVTKYEKAKPKRHQITPGQTAGSAHEKSEAVSIGDAKG